MEIDHIPGAAAQKRQQYKSFVLSYLNDNEGPQRRDQILRDIKDQEKLTKDERNSLDQVIDSMIENAIVSLKYDEEQRECIELCDLTCTITKEKRKSPNASRKEQAVQTSQTRWTAPAIVVIKQQHDVVLRRQQR
nr:uncharacterized protein LOC113813313 [Penaeus vannamei]